MRIEDKDILSILEKDGPALSGYIADKLKIIVKSDRQKLNRHLKMLTVYGFIQRVARDKNYIYYIPGDKRPPNYPDNHQIQKREKLRELVNNMEPGDTINGKQVEEITGYTSKWAQKLLIKAGFKPVDPPKKNVKTNWKKGAQE